VQQAFGGRWMAGVHEHCAWPDYGRTSDSRSGPERVSRNLVRVPGFKFPGY